MGTGQLIDSPPMPGWDSFSIRHYLREDCAAPVFVDNDVNLMALDEFWRLQRCLQSFLVINIGISIGCGIVCVMVRCTVEAAAQAISIGADVGSRSLAA